MGGEELTFDVWRRGGLKFGGGKSTGFGDFSRSKGGGERLRKFLAGGGNLPPSALVGKTLMFDYLTKTSIINLKELTVNSINCIVWESNLSIRTQK